MTFRNFFQDPQGPSLADPSTTTTPKGGLKPASYPPASASDQGYRGIISLLG